MNERLIRGECLTTFETAELVLPRFINHDRRGQPFSAEKLCTTGTCEVKSLVVGELVMGRLQKLGEVACIRISSVHPCFQDLSEFREEIDLLAREPSKK